MPAEGQKEEAAGEGRLAFLILAAKRPAAGDSLPPLLWRGWQALPVSPGALCGPRLGHLLCVPHCAKHFTLALARRECPVVRTLDPICSTLAPASATCELRVRPWPGSLTPLCLSLLICKMGVTTVLTPWLPWWLRG